ncbi:MAG: HEPN domain-containing protein [Paludibacteraceae bacterium]|nr:HEPN domain-containing protein [Paludibacteraceae bacterium]
MDKVKYWIDIADYDFATAQDLMKSKRWLYVGFMCHQTIEKTLKAYWAAKRDDEPPYIHNLIRLSELSGLQEQMAPEQIAYLDVLTPMNIEARYPSYKSRLAAGLNESVCADLMQRTEQLQLWIKSKL